MKRILFTVLVGFLFISPVKADDYDTLFDRLFTEYVSSSAASQATIQGYMNTQQADGSWSTINYDIHTYIGGWEPLEHMDRLLKMALAFKKTGHALKDSTILLSKIKLGLIFWYERKPYSDNWFDNDIGIQADLFKILILIKNDCLEASDWTNVIVAGCDKYLVLPTSFSTPSSKSTLTNAVWIARNLVHHGIIKKDQVKLQQGINIMADQLVIKSIGVDGVQRDNSFLTHIQILYNSGYGNEFIKEVSYYMNKVRGLTLVGFTAAQIATLSDLLLKGDQWMMQSKAYDFSVMGRNISRINNGSTSYLNELIGTMKLIDPSKSTQYDAMLNNVSDPTGATPSVIGNKYFYRADFMAHRAPNLYIGIKMCSSRTRGTESLNNENLLANWLPFGATTIMRRGDEYYNIFGAWDWSKIPGVTNPAVTVVWPTNTTTISTQTTTFVGGVSDGNFGVTAMDFNKITTGGTLPIDITARKANFLFNNEMICLGAGITSSYYLAPTTTTLNQTYLKGSVLVNGVVIPQDDKSYNDVKWIYHDNTGYVFRTNTTAIMKTNAQSGNWYTINQAQTNASVTTDIFKLWLDHGTAPSNATYEYAVLPNFTANETLAYATSLPVETISNTTALQAITHKTLQQTGAVFYTAGTFTVNATLRVTVDKPCILLIDWAANPIKVTASDPNQNQTTLNVILTYSGVNSETLVFTLPNLTAKGSSLKLTASNSYSPPDQLSIKGFEKLIDYPEAVLIFPNPSAGKFSVKLSESLTGGTIKVFNIMGQVVYSVKNASSDNSIKLDNNFKGIGVVVVENEVTKIVKKIVIK